jgi:chaperone modulatory protein CbpM
VSYALVRASRLDLDSFAAVSGLHPDLVRRLVTLGVLDATPDNAGGLWFSARQVSAVARMQRLRAAFPLNYASVGLVCDLLDRIAILETALRRGRQPRR